MFGPQLTDILIRSVAVATFVEVPPEAKLVPDERQDPEGAAAAPAARHNLASWLYAAATGAVMALAGSRAQWRGRDGRTPAQRLGEIIG